MIPGQSVDLDRLVREEADRLDATEGYQAPAMFFACTCSKAWTGGEFIPMCPAHGPAIRMPAQ
jgi:hypothetical protein